MKKVTFCVALLLLCFGSNVFSQSNFSTIPSKAELAGTLPTDNFPDFTDPTNANDPRCGTMQGIEHRIANDPFYAKQHQDAQQISKSGSQSKIACDGSNTIIVPIAFHFANNAVTGNCANEQCLLTEVQDQLDALNLAFGNNTGTPQEQVCPQAYQDANGNSVASTGTCITFCLAIPPAGNAQGLDPACDPPITVGSFTGGLNGGGNGAPGWGGILNVFITNGNCLGVADGIPGAANGDGVTVCSEAFGGFGGPAGCNLDDNNTFGLGATLTHEIGHYLGLYHTFQGGCGTQETNPPGPFNINDTPAHANPTSGNPGGCTNSGCGGGVTPTANFMDYTNDAGMSMFTEDQAQVMNYWANQRFGATASQCSAPNPTQLTSVCQNQTCNVVCPTSVNTQYAGSADVCSGVGSYNLPSAYDASAATTNTALVLDIAQSATYGWSTGNYVSAGGTSIGGSITLSNPAGCNPVAETYYLNVGCSDGSAITDTDGGVFTLNVYPDPAQFTAADLVTVGGENTCNEPALTANCAGVTITPDAANPAFPVANGQSGTANYTITYAPTAGAPNCCASGTGGELLTNGDFEAGVAGWTEAEEVPTGTPNPNPFGVIGVSGDVMGSTDAWFGGWGGTGGSTISISQNITIPDNCSEALLSFDFAHVCEGNATITLEVLIGGVSMGFLDCTTGAGSTILTITPFDVIALGAPTGATTITFVGVETDPNGGAANDSGNIFLDNVSLVSGNCATAACDVTVTADYDCSGAACATVDLDILFDGFPGQTSWEIIDATGAVVASSGGTYSGTPGNSTTTESNCLFDGCYTLNFNDSASNGLCPFRATASSQGTFITAGTVIAQGTIVATLGTVVAPGLCGNFTLTDAGGTTLASGGGSFGGLSSQQFCLSGGLAPLWQPDNDEEVYMKQQQQSLTGLNVFPTLAKDNLSVYYSSQTVEPVQLNIVDMNGQIIQQYEQRTPEMQLNVSELPAGIYFVQMVAGDTVLVEKFVKQ